jgi:NAD(P)H dehydrogenase (quinone)
MPKILVLYYSRSGNTEKMANAAANGAGSVARTDVELNYYVSEEQLSEYEAILVGTPTYHRNMPSIIKNYFEEAAMKNVSLRGKSLLLSDLMDGAGNVQS